MQSTDANQVEASHRVPIEIILHICSFSLRTDLTSFARLSKPFRKLVLSMLYSIIYIKDVNRAYKCCRTLATSEDDLAGLVKSLTIDIPKLAQTATQSNCYEYLLGSLLRMTSLRHYRCTLLYAFYPDMCAALSQISTLRHLSVPLPSNTTAQFEAMAKDGFPDVAPNWPKLHTLEFGYENNLPFFSGFCVSFLHKILSSNPNSLRKLRIQTYYPTGNILSMFLPHQNLLQIEHLHLPTSQLDVATTSQLPNLKSLILYADQVSPGTPLPRNSVPHLEYYSGSSQFLPTILKHPRPLRTIHLDGAYLYPNPMMTMFRNWDDVLASLRYIPNSKGPVKELWMAAKPTEMDRLPEAAPYLATIENFMITFSLYNVDTGVLIANLARHGTTLFAQMPHLQTLVLSELPYLTNQFTVTCHSSIQKALLSRWKRCCPSLRRVAFGHKFVWETMGDGGDWRRGETSDLNIK